MEEVFEAYIRGLETTPEFKHFRTEQNNIKDSSYMIDGERSASIHFSIKLLVYGSKVNLRGLLVGMIVAGSSLFAVTFVADPVSQHTANS